MAISIPQYKVNEFQVTESNVAGVRPPVAYGTAITPAQNAYGSYTQLSLTGTTTVVNDIWEITIIVNSVTASGANRDCLVTIGKDDSGGSSYSDWITDLVCGPASNCLIGQAMAFKFPIRVPPGASLAAKASVNNATLTALNVAIILKGKPTHPESIYRGAYVTTFGANTAASNGTTVTPGTTSDGAWVQMGSTLTKPHCYWEMGYGIDDATMSNAAIFVDIGLGDATNKRVIVQDALIITSALENIFKASSVGTYALGAIGDNVYGRSQSSATADANNSMAVYGVGG